MWFNNVINLFYSSPRHTSKFNIRMYHPWSSLTDGGLYKKKSILSSPYSHFYVGSMYDDIHLPVTSTVIHFISRQSLFFDSVLYLSNHLLLGLPLKIPSPMCFHFHRPPSYAVLLSSHHMPIIPYHFNFLSWNSFAFFLTFVVPLILSFLILSSFVTPHIHRSIHISATSNFFSCAFFNAHVSAPHTSAVI